MVNKKILKNNTPEKNIENSENRIVISKKTTKKEKTIKEIKKEKFLRAKVLNQIEIILPTDTNKKIVDQLINSFELSIYKKQINNITLNINKYANLIELKKILISKSEPGKIFIGTFKGEDTKIVKEFCKEGILFFSFSSDKKLAEDCTYLINFFPDDDLNALFNYFPEDSKIALLYPENYYGYNINNIIDPIASNSQAIIINRASYKQDLSNAREAIKELGKYELRRYELKRQKTLLENKKDEKSKKTLKKILKFETMANVDFTHLILPDYSIRLLEIAPLLPFYDIDPDKVQFVGTGVWDDKIFFDEPSLQGSIFSGIEEKNREDFFYDYQYIYDEKPLRTSTIPYDLLALIDHLVDNEMNTISIFNFLNNSKIKFDGIDGKFFFENNIIVRELNILKIDNGKAYKIN